MMTVDSDQQLSLLDSLVHFQRCLKQVLAARYGTFSGHSELEASLLKELAATTGQDCTQALMAQRLGVSESTLSSQVERLRRRGDLCRKPDTTDRRRSMLQLTEQGHSRTAQIRQDDQLFIAPVLERLTVGHLLEQTQMLQDFLQEIQCLPENSNSNGRAA